MTVESFTSIKNVDARECLQQLSVLIEVYANSGIETLPLLSEGTEVEPGTYGTVLGRRQGHGCLRSCFR